MVLTMTLTTTRAALKEEANEVTQIPTSFASALRILAVRATALISAVSRLLVMQIFVATSVVLRAVCGGLRLVLHRSLLPVVAPLLAR